LAVKDFRLTLKAFELAFSGVARGRKDRLQGNQARFGPWSRLRVGASLVFKPSQSAIKELETALHVSRLFPFPVTVDSCEGRDRLGEAA
jgi:hypothetical protein